jgi:hypothetical protein
MISTRRHALAARRATHSRLHRLQSERLEVAAEKFRKMSSSLHFKHRVVRSRGGTALHHHAALSG